MAKHQRRYVCQGCGYFSSQWLGRCPNCGAWDTFVEETITPKRPAKGGIRIPPKPLNEVELSTTPRIYTGISEFDRVLGGGVVRGSLVLVGGEPGIGKSTLLLQSAAKLAGKRMKVLYVSGEESPQQIKLRATRLNIPMESGNIYSLAQTDIGEIIVEIDNISPDVVIIDSIQTTYEPELDTLPGSVTQVKECTLRLMEMAKRTGIPVFLIGHVTKEGAIAGPRTLEHIVDTVLYLEGDRNHYYRILRAVKNRFGSTQEIGVFEMATQGLLEVRDPSFSFLGHRETNPPGTAVTCIMEGSRPFLVEIQALLTPCVFRMPQRVSGGIDYKRIAMLMAIVERQVGIKVSTHDVFINVVGGLHIEETASDLAVILAIVSAARNIQLPVGSVVFGEVGLAGEVRLVGLIEKRLKEAERLGFTLGIIPLGTKGVKAHNYQNKPQAQKMKVIPVKDVREAITKIKKIE